MGGPIRLGTLSLRGLLAPLCFAAIGAGAASAQEPSAVPERLTLAEALRLAEIRNPALEAFGTLGDFARAEWERARARPNPALTLAFERSGAGAPEAAVSGERTLIFHLGQPLESPGWRHHRLRVATAARSVAASTIQNARRRLWREIGEAYFHLAHMEARLAALEQGRAAFDRIVELTEARVRAHEVAGVELRRLEMEQLRIVDETLGARLARREARTALLGLLGVPDAGEFVVAADGLAPIEIRAPSGEEVAGADGLAVSREHLRDIARATRPDLRAARLDRERAAAGVALARAGRFPGLGTGLLYERAPGNATLGVQFSVPVPLLNPLNPGAVRGAAADRRRTAALEAAAWNLARIEVRQAADAVEASARRSRLLAAGLARSATPARDLTRSAYEVGEASLLDFLDAQREFQRAVRLLYAARFDLSVSLVRLAAALGLDPAGAHGWATDVTPD